MPRIAASAVLLILGLSTASLAQAPAGREPRSYSVGSDWAMPFRARSSMHVQMEEVQRELKLTETQKQRHVALSEK